MPGKSQGHSIVRSLQRDGNISTVELDGYLANARPVVEGDVHQYPEARERTERHVKYVEGYVRRHRGAEK